MRYAFIHTERQTYPVRLLCAVLQVSRNGYYQFVQGGGGRSQPTRELIGQVQLIHRASRRTYGSRRLCQALQQAGCHVGRHDTRTLMRHANLKPRRARRRPQTTDCLARVPHCPQSPQPPIYGRGAQSRVGQ